MKYPIDRFKRLTAKRLRHHETQAEKILWHRLRQLELAGTHFRRQVPIGRYIADFACLTHRLIVEVDGSQHGKQRLQATIAKGRVGLKKKAITCSVSGTMT